MKNNTLKQNRPPQAGGFLTPLISVCLPLYDTEQYLERCLRSIITQDYNNFEIVIVSDKSRGHDSKGRNAKQIAVAMQKECNKYRKTHGLSKVNIYFREHRENRGLIEVRRTLVEESSGEYIAMVDSDDCLEDGALKALVSGIVGSCFIDTSTAESHIEPHPLPPSPSVTERGNNKYRSRITPQKLALAKQFRKEPTPSENNVWQLLRNRQMLNLKWKRQQVIEGFIADFYCPELNLALEIDGSVHDNEDARNYDAVRDSVFADVGIKTIRIRNSECDKETITKLLTEYTASKAPSPCLHGEGVTCRMAGGGEADIVHGTTTAGVFGEDGIFTPAEVNRYGQITYGSLNGHDIFHGWLMGNAMSGTSWGKLIRRDLFVKAYEHIPYTECNMAEDFLLFFFISQYARRYVGIQDKVYKYGLSSGMSSVRRIDTLHKWKMICSAASVFSVIVQWIEQENEADRQPLAEDEINDIRQRTSFYLANNLKQLKETVVPELQSEAHQMLCDYWGQHFVERIEEMIKSSE